MADDGEFDGTLIIDTFAPPASFDEWDEQAAELTGVYGETARAVIADGRAGKVKLDDVNSEIERRMDALPINQEAST